MQENCYFFNNNQLVTEYNFNVDGDKNPCSLVLNTLQVLMMLKPINIKIIRIPAVSRLSWFQSSAAYYGGKAKSFVCWACFTNMVSETS